MENFLLFFNLPGLWGAKLFQQFDKDGNQLITGQQFLYAVSVTARATFNQKIQLLYNFFEGNLYDGITYKQFIKMLYNFSKEDIKSILIQDGVFVQQWVINTQTIENISQHCSNSTTECNDHNSNTLQIKSQLSINKPQKSVVFLDYKCPPTAIINLSQFQNAYKDMINCYEDPGTCIQVKAQNKTYRIQYCNMITLVKEFASHVYKKYGKCQQTGKLTFKEFQEWIKGHLGLFQMYFKAFHIELWGVMNGNKPNYADSGLVEMRSEGRLQHNGKTNNAYFMLVGDVLIVCNSLKTSNIPIKMICLVGLTINKKNIAGEFGMQIRHTSDNYLNSTIYFKTELQQQQWLTKLKIYGGESLQNKYDLLQMIGTGKFSTVYKCVSKESGKAYALKVIETLNLPIQAKSAIMYIYKHHYRNQSNIMRVAKHPQIIKYYQTFTTRNSINLILDYVEGQNLFEFVKENGSIDEYQTAFVIGQIIKAIRHLHRIGIIHRDLKPENVMVTFKEEVWEIHSPVIRKKNKETQKDIGNQLKIETKSVKSQNSSRKYRADNSQTYREIKNVKVIDFGLANHISQLVKFSRQSNKSYTLELMCGTPNYIAPQILMNQKPSFKVDNFAIGSIMYFMLRGKLTFTSYTAQQVLIKTVRGDYSLQDSKWDLISDEAKDLIRKLLESDPIHRIELEQALNHPWFRKVSKQGINIDSIKLMSHDEGLFMDNQNQSNLRLTRRKSAGKQEICQKGAIKRNQVKPSKTFEMRKTSIDLNMKVNLEKTDAMNRQQIPTVNKYQ